MKGFCHLSQKWSLKVFREDISLIFLNLWSNFWTLWIFRSLILFLLNIEGWPYRLELSNLSSILYISQMKSFLPFSLEFIRNKQFLFLKKTTLLLVFNFYEYNKKGRINPNCIYYISIESRCIIIVFNKLFFKNKWGVIILTVTMNVVVISTNTVCDT